MPGINPESDLASQDQAEVFDEDNDSLDLDEFEAEAFDQDDETALFGMAGAEGADEIAAGPEEELEETFPPMDRLPGQRP